MVGGRLMVRLVSTNLLLLLLHLHLLLHLVQGADISLDAICGNKLVRIKPPSLSLCHLTNVPRTGGFMSKEDLPEGDWGNFLLC